MAFVTAPTNRFKMHFKDDVGRPASMECHLDAGELDPAGGGAAIIAAATAACSDDALVSQEIIVTGVNDTPGSPTDGPYSRGADKMSLVLSTTDGTGVTIQLGSPNEAGFAPGNVYVNPTATNIAGLITALIANACNADGSAIVAFVRGYRRRPPRRKHA